MNMPIHRRAPMLRVALALAAGILLAEWLPGVPRPLLWTALAVAATLLGIGLWRHGRKGGGLFRPALWVTIIVTSWLSVPPPHKNIPLLRYHRTQDSRPAPGGHPASLNAQR